MDTLRRKMREVKLALNDDNKKKEDEHVSASGIKCPSCENVFEKIELGKLKICPKCARYFRLNSKERIRSIADEGSFKELDSTLQAKNPLDFPDYEEKIAKMQP
jgi:acetyl-CoA carboxylase carboxyl transferase subunit beta